MSGLNDISNSDAGFDSNSVPTSKIDHSDKYKPNPNKPVEAVAPSAVPRPEKPDNRKSGVPDSSSKGGAGAHNWGSEAVTDVTPPAEDDLKVAAEKHLEPETAAEEQHARAEAADPNPQSKTLEEYEKEGHKI